MAVILGVVLVLVVVGFIYGAISTYGNQQRRLRERAAEREASGEAERLRAEHARREAEAKRLED